MVPHKTAKIINWVFDGLLVSIVIAAYWILEFISVPFQRGFFCDDESLRYPEKPDSLNYWASFPLGACPVLAVIFFVDIYLNCTKTGKFRLSNFFIILDDILVYLFGAFGTYFTSVVMKITVGGMRPYFLNYCFRDKAEFDAVCPPGKEHYFVTNYTCSGNGIHLMNLWMSFPSGHACYITFSMVFITIYLSKYMRDLTFKYLVPFFQLGFINIALYIAASRSSDYKHHWGDIVVGVIHGLCFALYCGLYLLNNKMEEYHSKSELSKQTNNCNYQSIESFR